MEIVFFVPAPVFSSDAANLKNFLIHTYLAFLSFFSFF